MKFIKTLLLIALLSRTSASDVPEEESNEEVLYEGNRRAPPTEECFCLVRHPMMVPVVNYLDSDSHGLNRLVVYLYEDKKTGQIHAYIPGAENQRKFPDISLDLYGNEIFVVNKELTVTTVFERSKNVIPLTDSIKSPQDSKYPQKPAADGLHDSKNIIPLTDSINYSQGSKYPQKPEVDGLHDLEPEISPHQLLIYDLSNGNKQTHTESSSKIHTHINTQPQPQIHTQTYPKGYTQTHSQIYSHTYIHQHPQTHSETEKQTHTQNYQQSQPEFYHPSYPQTDINGPLNLPSTGKHFHYDKHAVNFDNQVNDDRNTLSGSNNSPYHEIYHYATPSVVKVPDNTPSLDTVQVDSITADTIPAEPISIDRIAIDRDVSVNKGSGITLAPSITGWPVGDEDAISATRVFTAFDVWFKGQIKKVRDEQLTAHYVLDGKTLEANVKKILQENHIKFTINGKLQDSHGNIMSFSRLKLRPVLIGDSVGYEKIKHRHKFVFSRDLTYLEAILITVSYPPKILGIVPLRKVTLPQISQQPEMISKSVTPKSQDTSAAITKSSHNISNDETNPKQHQPERQMTPKNKGKVVETVKEYNITFDGEHGPPTPANLEYIFGTSPASKQKSSNKTQTTTRAAVDGRKSLNSDEIEKRGDANDGKGTIDMFESLLSQTLGKLKDFFPISILGKNVEKEAENSSEDPLGFRIIGGEPATLSGKMVNSRGRSGFIY